MRSALALFVGMLLATAVHALSLAGLYLMIADEEKAIRRNPAAAVGNLAQKVFGAIN